MPSKCTSYHRARQFNDVCAAMEQLEREWNVITFVSLFDLKGEHHMPKQFQQLQWY